MAGHVTNALLGHLCQQLLLGCFTPVFYTVTHMLTMADDLINQKGV